MIIKQVHQFIQKHDLIPEGSTIVLGLSGGPDSLFLLHLLMPLHKKGTITLIAAHLDHQWREHSHKDVQFCLEATQGLGILLVIGKMSELATEKKMERLVGRIRPHHAPTIFDQSCQRT